MKPLNLIALLCFLGGATWALTRSEGTVQSIQKRYYAVMKPFLKSGTAAENTANHFLKEVQHSRELEAQLNVTKTELDRLRLIEQRFSSLEAENARQKKELDFKANAPFSVVAARIIGREQNDWFRTIRINQGEDAHIGNQNPVLTAEGLVGKIDLTEKSFARVILLTDPKCQVSAKVEGSPEVGIISGRPANYGQAPMLSLRYLSKNANLKKGQRVFTNGRGGIFPPNLLLGKIETIEHGALDSEALVTPAVNFSDLSTVFVIPTSQEQ